MRNPFFYISMVVAVLTAVAVSTGSYAAQDHVVYSVYQGIDMGNPGEKPPRDYYVNMGTKSGVTKGTVLKVLRRTASYDLNNRVLYKDVTFPIAEIKVIHAEPEAAIARLVKMEPAEMTPAISPRAVMVGDLVRKTN